VVRKLILLPALHVLVRTHILVFTCQQLCMFLVIIDQICRKRSRSIWPLDLDDGLSEGNRDGSNLEKNILTRFFEGPTLGIICMKNSPLSRNSGTAERKRPGRVVYYEHTSKEVSRKPFRLDQSC